MEDAIMVKPALTALLAITCLFLVKANIDTFRAPSSDQETSAVTKKGSTKKSSPIKPLGLNPRVSPKAPDLGSGYLFNAERFLAKGTPAAKTGKGYGQNIRMDDVVFSGAILGEGYKKALVSYRVAPTPVPRSTKRPATKKNPGKGEETVQLTVGDTLAGYTVKDITSDFILFIKGSDSIKKTLFDPSKKRQQLPSRPANIKVPKRKPGVVPPRRPQPPPAKRP